MSCHPLVRGLRCSVCGRVFEASSSFRYTCCDCGSGGILEMLYDPVELRQSWPGSLHSAQRGLSRYLSWLPLRSQHSLPPTRVGDTPLVRVDRLAQALGLQQLWIKEDHRNPTGSFKDRASALVIAGAQEQQAQIVTAASTGNAASSLAGLAASVGLASVLFVPVSTPEAKVVQLLMYGAQVLLVEGSYDDAFELSLEATRQFGWFNRNTGYNPLTLEGKKTCALELFEELPDIEAVFVSVGDGCIIAGLGKGFLDLQRAGLLQRLPRLYGVQAEGSSVLSRAHREGILRPLAEVATYADSLCVAEPRVAHLALEMVRQSGGSFISLCDDSIRQAQRQLANLAGIFAEPAAAAAVAGLAPAVQGGLIGPAEKVVVISTGHGLKDLAGARSALGAWPQLISAQPRRLAEGLRQAGII